MVVDGDIVFTTATSPGKDVRKGGHAKFFEAHRDPRAFDRVFGRMEVDYSSFQNEWGHGRMVLVPFRNSHGHPYCFGASMNINDVLAAQRDLLLHTLMLGCGVLAAGLLGTLLLGRVLSRPILSLTASAERITRGNLNEPVTIAGPAEVGQLATALDTMRLAISDKITALRASEDKYRRLLQNLSIAVVVHAPDTRITYSNPMAATLLGLTTEQMQGRQAVDPAWHFEREDGTPMPLEDYPVNRVIATGQPLFNYVVGVHRPDLPDTTWVLVNAFPELDSGQQLRQVVVTFVDITALQQAEAHLRENEAVLRSFFDSPGIMRGIVEVVNNDLLYITGNTVTADFYGRTQIELRNQTATALGVPQDTIQLWISHYKASQASGQPVSFVYAHQTDKEEKWFASVVNFLGLTAQQQPRFAYTVRDITDIKRLEAQLVQAQKMEAIGQLAGGVAHDFNNILQAINGFTEMAQDDLEPHHPAYASLTEVAKAGTRAAKLVGQLLAFSRRQILEPAHLDLNEVVGNLLGMLERVIGEHIRLDLIPGHHLGTVHADRTMLEQVVLNLCVNARDAMPQGGRLTIETENVTFDSEYCARNPWARPGRYLLLSVTDTGCGMDALTLERIFEPFFSTKGPGKGTGLGLSMVYGIVRQHEGMVRAYSEVGKGTTFKVYLPVVERPADSVGTKIESLPLGGNETILVAEDDASVRELARETLTRAGYTVLLAANGAEALAVFQQHAAQVKLLLLDVVMPELGGREVYDHIHAEHPHLAAVFASGYSENAIHTNFVLQEGMKLIRKPYNTAELLRAVRTALDNSAAK
jgi:PAS domain S-box-containing protein